jgi:oxygen-independent coproporphyrinogen-3 oxidase
VKSYIGTLRREIAEVSKHLPESVTMGRLHLGGGTPTLLAPDLMDQLLSGIFDVLPAAPDFEFSVEIDPTEASPALLDRLMEWGLTRASIGVQDFAEPVQKAIGRLQSFEQTQEVVDHLRDKGIEGINLDLLYGLPFQTERSLARTLTQVLSLRPDRMALYGYAHVPQMSKRQVMIKDADLPSTRMRYQLQKAARQRLLAQSYQPVGIDHFALSHDGLARAAANKTLRRNFQGYTDDPCETLIGFGASAISQFKQGFSQNAVATAAYTERVWETGAAGHRGFVMTDRDHLVGAMIEDLMCYHEINLPKIEAATDTPHEVIFEVVQHMQQRFPDALSLTEDRLVVDPTALSLTRILATALNEHCAAEPTGSLAI